MTPSRGAAPLALAGCFLLAFGADAWIAADREYSTLMSLAALAVGAVLVAGGLHLRGVAAHRCSVVSMAVGGVALVVVACSATPGFLSLRLPPVAWIVDVVIDGSHATADDVRVRGGGFTLALAPTMASCAGAFWVTFLICVGTTMLFWSDSARAWYAAMARSAAMCFLAMAWVYLVSVAVCIVDPERNVSSAPGFSHVGDSRWTLALGWIAIPMCTWMWSSVASSACPPAWGVRWSSCAGAAAVAVSLTTVTFGQDLLKDASTPCAPHRIVIDDAHSGFWEGSARQFDMRYFGDMAQYNYGAAMEWLSRDNDVHIHEHGPIDDTVLHDASVLMLKTPSIAFTRDEEAGIRRWMRDGGALVLLGDHTNLFGMNEKLNRFLDDVPIRFGDDGVNSVTGGLSMAAGRLFAHGIWRGVGRTEMMTSCSLALGHGAEGMLCVPQSLMDKANYGRDSYFGDFHPDGDEVIGVSWVAARARVGRGRVVCFSDSTVFSNFALSEPGHDRMWTALIRSAVSDQEMQVPAAVVTLLLGACGLLVMAHLLWRSSDVGDSVRTIVLGLAIGVSVGFAADLALLAPVERRCRATLFDTHARRLVVPARNVYFALSPAIGFRSPELEQFSISTFLTLSLRSSVVPHVVRGDEDPPQTRPGDTLMVVRPCLPGPADPVIATWIDNAMNSGANVLYATTRQALLETLHDGGAVAQHLRTSGLGTLESCRQAVVMHRGNETPERGRLDVLDADLISDAALGHCFDVPDERTLSWMHEIASEFSDRK